MFYESWGLLLARADDVLRSQVRGHVSDARARDQLDAVATLLGDLAAMWPRLFAGLERETVIFQRELNGDPPEPGDIDADPLRSHRDAVRALNERVEQVHRLRGEDRRVALERLRAALRAAAEVQGGIVEPAAARAADSRVRRI
jgi:hypothetical protein